MGKENILNNLKENISVEKFRKENARKNKMKNVLQMSFAVLICTLSITGIVMAENISTKVYENFFEAGSGMGHAIEEGYIEKPEMEFEASNTVVENKETGEKIEDTETKVKVDEIVMDDFNLSMTFNVNLSDKALEVAKAEDIWEMNFTDMMITDENGYILFAGTDKYKDIDTDSEKFINTGVNTFLTKRSGSTLKVVYNIYTGSTTFPKSKELNVKFSKINISKDDTVNTMFGEGEITLTGNWDFKVDVPEKMYNRTSLIYTQKSSTNKNFKVTKAVLRDTGMEVEIEVGNLANLPERPTSLELEFYKSLPEDSELKSLDISTYLGNNLYQTEEYKNYVEAYNKAYEIEAYLLNANNEKFEFTQGPRENGSKSISEEGVLTYNAMYDLTKYDGTDEITVCIKKDGKEEKIVLLKKGE